MDAMRDMLQCIEFINLHVAGSSSQRIEHTPELRDAVLYRLIVLGEAAGRVSERGRDDYPDIPWVLAVKTRNFLIHVYDKIKWEIVWKTIELDLPELDRQLRRALDLPPATQQ